MAETVCLWFMAVMCTLCMVQMVNARLIGNEVEQGDLDTGIEVSERVSSTQINL